MGMRFIEFHLPAREVASSSLGTVIQATQNSFAAAILTDARSMHERRLQPADTAERVNQQTPDMARGFLIATTGALRYRAK
jgi:hypothetical protein